MSERAVAVAMTLALTIGALTQSSAQGSNGPGTIFGAARATLLSQNSNYQTGFKAEQTSTVKSQYPGSTPTGWQTSQNTARVRAPKAAPSMPGVWTPGSSNDAEASAAPATAGTKTTKKRDDTITVCEGPANVAKSAQWQRFDNTITLKPGQDQLNPLTLVVTNGGGAPAFANVSILLSGRPIAAMKNFNNNVMTMSVVGAVSGGDNQLLIKAYGPVGAKISWKVTTLKPVLTAANPTSIAPGQDITLTGRNFSLKAAAEQVMFGDKPGTIKTTAAKQIVVTAPDGLSGDQNVVVWVGGIATKGLKVSVKSAPEVTSCDVISSPPGQTITVSGKGFSAKSSENQVTIGGLTATVTATSPTSITCVIPEMESPQWNVPIQVTTNKVPSKGAVTINVQRRYIENNGAPEQ